MVKTSTKKEQLVNGSAYSLLCGRSENLIEIWARFHVGMRTTVMSQPLSYVYYAVHLTAALATRVFSNYTYTAYMPLHLRSIGTYAKAYDTKTGDLTVTMHKALATPGCHQSN